MKQYGSIQYYDNHLILYPQPYSIWSNYTDETKLILLQMLSKKLDKSGKWVGLKKDLYQDLEFPRNFDDLYFKEDLVDPYFRWNKKIPESLYDLMVDLLKAHLENDNLLNLQNKNIKSISDNLISVSFGDKGSIETSNPYKLVERYLFDFTVMGYTQYSKKVQGI
jgi:hypothetical protein